VTNPNHAEGLAWVREFLARAASVIPRDLGVDRFRAALVVSPEHSGTAPPIASVEDVDADGVRVRRYDPAPATERRAVVLYLHGGAFVRGSLDSADPVCRRIADAATCVVLSVDYRLAPEHPFPAALDDTERVLDWAIEHADELGIDPQRIVIAGDSAGATLATTVARRNPARVLLQVLLCGLYDLTAEIRVAGRAAVELDVAREQGTLDWVASLYLPDAAQALDPDASPLLVADHSGAPEAVVVTSELDPFAQQTREYAEALRRGGVPVTEIDLAGLPHAFINFAGVFPEAGLVCEIVAVGIRRLGSDGRDPGRPRAHGEASSRRSDLRGAP